MTQELLIEWEKRCNKQYPGWGTVWHYEPYGECWEAVPWNDVKVFYENERMKQLSESDAIWWVVYEPIIANPESDLPKPRWGDGVILKRENYKEKTNGND